MNARLFSCAIAAAALIAATPVVAQQILNAQTSKADPQQAVIADFTAQYRDKGWNKEVVELFYTIKIDRAAYDRVQAKFRHTDQRMIIAARDTRDLRLSGRKDYEDISTLTREEVNQLRRLALQGGGKSGTRK